MAVFCSKCVCLVESAHFWEHSTSSLSSHKSTQSARDHTYRDNTHYSYLPSSRHKVPSSYLAEQHARSHHHWSRDLLNLHARKGRVSDNLTVKSVGVNGSISAGAVKPLLYVSRSHQHSALSSRASSVRGSPRVWQMRRWYPPMWSWREPSSR